MASRRPLPARASTPVGTVYLLHFEPAFKHAQHYIGFTTDADKRLMKHLQGNGANLVKHAMAAGCEMQLALERPGTLADEYALKARNGASRWCPICLAQRMGPKLPPHMEESHGAGEATENEIAAAL